MARLLSLNVGLPREVTWNGRTVRTAIWKLPVKGWRMVRRLNIDGDAQADLAGHGGEQRAAFVYQMDSDDYWKHFLGRDDFTFGQFGENFTVEGLADDEVCTGDRYRIGDAEFEVTQPRVTCVGIRMNEPRMPPLLVAHRRPEFYFRVLQEGKVGLGDDIVKVAAGPEKITLAEMDALWYCQDTLRTLKAPTDILDLFDGSHTRHACWSRDFFVGSQGEWFPTVQSSITIMTSAVYSTTDSGRRKWPPLFR